MLARVGVDHIPMCAQSQGTNPWDNIFYYRFNSYKKLVTGYETEVRQKKIRLVVFFSPPKRLCNSLIRRQDIFAEYLILLGGSSFFACVLFHGALSTSQ